MNPKADCVFVSSQEEAFPVESQSIDLVVCIEVDVVEAPWFVPELKRILRGRGVAVFTVNNRRSYRGTMANLKSMIRGDNIYYSQSYHEVQQQLTDEGFELLHQEGFGWFPFSRFSNSSPIPLVTPIEGWLHLHRLVRWAPCVALACQKADE